MNIKDWENTKKNLMLSEKNSFGDRLSKFQTPASLPLKILSDLTW